MIRYMSRLGKILIIIAVLLIVGGIGYTLISRFFFNSIDENRNYVVIEETTSNSFNSVSNPDNFSILVDQIGFENANCESLNDEFNSQLCTASHLGYSNLDLEDAISATYRDSLVNQFSMNLYFTADDFIIGNIINQSNAVIKNFFGTDVDSNNVSLVMSGLNERMSDEDPVFVQEFQVGDYTEQINMQYIQDSDVYVVRFFIILSSQYQES